MSFANTYLSRYASGQVQKLPEPDPELFLVVVLPSFNEPDLLTSVRSLISANPPLKPWEIIVVVNEPKDCSPEHHKQNLKSISELKELQDEHNRKDLKINVLIPEPFPIKKAGPGLARKIGMDEAVRRFNSLENPGGIIVSFDADTICGQNYLSEISTFYKVNTDAGGCVHFFEHDLESQLPGESRRIDAIIQYELYLRYFKMALAWAGFPYANYSLGSAFSISSKRYVDAGGMGVQKAGEDFYFLQKCIPLGNFWELNTAIVYPSSRTSDRVLFGTGPFIEEFLREKKENLVVYPFELFKGIRPVFQWVNQLEEIPASLDSLDRIIQDFPDNISVAIKKNKWMERIEFSWKESAGIIPFKKRIYHEISQLQIIRLFNELISGSLVKQPVKEEFSKLMTEMGIENARGSACDLLIQARKLEKGSGNIRIS